MEVPAIPGNNRTVTVGDWIITFILSGIPLVGLVMLIVWAVSDDTPLSKRNWAKATLIIMIAAIVIGIVIVALAGGTAALMNAKQHTEPVIQ